MLKFNIVGTGAAGNKAVAELIETGYPKEQCYFINSTEKDIPTGYSDRAFIFGASSGRLGGCGKERTIGKKMFLSDLQSEAINLDAITSGNPNAIVVVGSCEGGSGSSSIPIIAKYIKDVHDIPVIVVLFFGFKDDVRGIQNTIEISQELSDNYTIIGIDNSRFLDEVNGNRFNAEKKANRKFIEITKLLIGGNILPGEQIIDDTDLYKLVTTPGYMVCDGIKLPSRIKTIDSFNDQITNAIYNHHFIDPPKDAGMKRLGLIFNVTSIEDTINYNAPQLDTLYGDPYEKFISLGIGEENEFFYIASGMKFPIDTIQKFYDEYVERSKRVNKSKDTFFDNVSQLRGDIQDSQFDMLEENSNRLHKISNKRNFFADFGIKDFQSGTNVIQTGAVDNEQKEDY